VQQAPSFAQLPWLVVSQYLAKISRELRGVHYTRRIRSEGLDEADIELYCFQITRFTIFLGYKAVD
jgi:hypothetical protein